MPVMLLNLLRCSMLATLLNADYAAQCWLRCSMPATLLNAGKDFNAAATLLNASKDFNIGCAAQS